MYPILDIKIPFEKRKDINNKIIHLVRNNIEHSQINKNVIFNSYSGDGGLHGLDFKEFNNYYDFKVAKQEKENGAFHTPLKVAKFMSKLLNVSHSDLICDMAAGIGNLINWMPDLKNVYLNELNLKSYQVMKYLFPECNNTNDDMRNFNPSEKMDIIIGNPPFNIPLEYNNNKYNSQLLYMLRASEIMKPAGVLCLIVPNSFLSDDFMEQGAIYFVNEHFNFVQSFILPSDTFKEEGAIIDTKILVFQRKSEHLEDKPYTTNHEPYILNSISSIIAQELHNRYIKPLYEQKEMIKQKLILETLRNDDKDQEFEYKVKKMLYHIKVGKNSNKHYNRAENYLLKFRTQAKQPDEDYKDWEKRKITKNKVISYLKKILKEQHKIERDEIKLVKTRYGLKLKPYNRSSFLKLNKMDISTKEMSFNDMILEEEYSFQDQTYRKLFDKKKKSYNSQGVLFSETPYNSELVKWLDNLVITDKENNQEIKLNEIQKQDTMKILSKNYGYLQWGTGSGKSISAIAQMKYRLTHNNIRNVFLVAPAIAINNNWDDILNNYGFDYVRINKLRDIENIKQGQIVIMTFNMLTKYKKFIKKHVKMQSQKVMLVLDEADSICNPSSKRTKAILDCFRKVKYKLLMSATSTRNSIPESFTAFELLYNNSYSMICNVNTIYVEDKKTKEIKEQYNEKYYLKPFPAYKKGYTLFKQCYSPEKVTVFGVGKQNQDIYNSNDLKRLIDSTMITRTFEEVSGKDIYKIIQNTTKFNQSENELYRVIVEEFYKLTHMYKSTGNSRKDSLLRIIQQLNSLLKACVTPNIFKGYYSSEMPSKAIKTLNMISKWNNEIVAIGCTHIKTVELYANYIRNQFPNRPLYIVTGDKTSLNKRKKIIKELKESKNGILICTQQSLSSSMNIDFVNRVLLIELQWNFAAMHQFFARFVRYTSTEQKEIHFLTIENSIESNLLKLILNKEKLNNFMKNDSIDDEEILERFGVEFDILSMLMTKETDEEGKSYINWGSQKVI
ncbi:DEAD/DEAH box helicase [Metabacillus fastidiosus]|uniref:DEAD/DEAH box helicase n=1 Tax=Metabacillus fastidiosus TaxID=1458 RepID=UPI003D2E1F6D